MTKIAISDINMNLKTRFRQNLGDLRPLIESIKRHGLLHPIVLSEDNQLICGRRRLAAYMQLKIPEIEVTYTSSKDLREAEGDENNETIRKSFTVEEIAEIDEFFRDREETAARIRQKKGVYLSDANKSWRRIQSKLRNKPNRINQNELFTSNEQTYFFIYF